MLSCWYGDSMPVAFVWYFNACHVGKDIKKNH